LIAKEFWRSYEDQTLAAERKKLRKRYERMSFMIGCKPMSFILMVSVTWRKEMMSRRMVQKTLQRRM